METLEKPCRSAYLHDFLEKFRPNKPTKNYEQKNSTAAFVFQFGNFSVPVQYLCFVEFQFSLENYRSLRVC